jgi:hypothetical protein
MLGGSPASRDVVSVVAAVVAFGFAKVGASRGLVRS